MYLKNTFPKTSDAEIKEEVLVGPNIRQFIQYVKYEDQQTEVEKRAWKSFKNNTIHFLGNLTAENYRDMVAELVNSYKAVGCNMPLKINLLYSHFDLFPENLGN
jgi:hypothetical protein